MDGSRGVKKRKIAQRDIEDIVEKDTSDEDGESVSGQSKPRNDKNKEMNPPLACPYFKHDPTKYTGRNWGSCCGPGWKTVHRVKEHLYRCHRQPAYKCPRCGESFAEEQIMKKHIRKTKLCVVRDEKQTDGFDSKQEAKLKSRKRATTELSEVEKWRQSYKILFPHVPEVRIPSPFYEYTEVHDDSLDVYEEYVLREMRGHLRPYLEQELESCLDIKGDVQRKIALEWFEKMQLKLLQEFRKAHQQTKISSASSCTLPKLDAATLETAIDTFDLQGPSDSAIDLPIDQFFLHDDSGSSLYTDTATLTENFGFGYGIGSEPMDPQTNHNLGSDFRDDLLIKRHAHRLDPRFMRIMG